MPLTYDPKRFYVHALPNEGTTRYEALGLLKDMMQKETVLVIDDYHFAACPESNHFIEFLVKSKIINLHFIIIARHT